MKLLKNIFLLSCIGFLIIACQSNSTDGKNKFKLSGTVLGTVDSTAFFKLDDSTYTINIKNDSFQFEIPIQENTIGSFSVSLAKVQIFAKPNEGLFLTISNDSVLYDGSLADFHNQLQELKNEQLEKADFSNLRTLYSMPQDSFISLIGNTNNRIKAALDTIVTSDHSWQKKIWSALTFELAMYSMNYPLYHGQLTNNDTFEIDKDYFLNLRTNFQLEDLAYLDIDERKELLRKFVEVQVRLDSPSISSDSVRLKLLFQQAEASFDKDTIVDLIITQTIMDQMKYQVFGDARGMIAKYVDRMPSSKEKEEIKEKISKWAQLQKGKDAPDFTAQQIDSTKVSLSELKGKVVYVDVWATWCGPCLREIPHLEKMYEKYADNDDIALVSVSIDSDYEKWYEKVTKDEMGGIQLWIENAWDSNLGEAYMINSIPRFILIDKQGKIVDADAPRPSSGEQIFSLIESEL